MGPATPGLLGLLLTMKPLPHESQYFQQHRTQGRTSVPRVVVRWKEGVPRISAVRIQGLVSATSRWNRMRNADVLHLPEKKAGS